MTVKYASITPGRTYRKQSNLRRSMLCSQILRLMDLFN